MITFLLKVTGKVTSSSGKIQKVTGGHEILWHKDIGNGRACFFFTAKTLNGKLG